MWSVFPLCVHDRSELAKCRTSREISQSFCYPFTEGQISQLQHRLQRLQRDQEDMDKEHKEMLTELQQKNDG